MFRANGRDQIQRPLVTAVVGKTGAWLKPGDVALAACIGVFPQREHRQLLDIETHCDAQAGGLVVQHGQGIAFGVAVGHHVVHGLIVVRGRCAISLPFAQIGFGLVIEWRHLLDRRRKAGALFQKRRAEVAVVQRLVFFRVIAIVGQRVIEHKARRTRFGDQFGLHAEVHFFESLLFQLATYMYCIRRGFVDVHSHLAGRDIRRATMQGQQLAVVHARMAYPLITTASDQFVEAFKPAQTATSVKLNERRIDHFLDWRIPPHARTADLGTEHIHPARGHHRQFHRAVIDINQAHAFLPTAVQGAHAD